MFRYNPQLLDDGLLDTYHRAYEFEIERKDTFGNKQNFAVAVLTLVIGAATALVSKLPPDGSPWTTAFYILLALTYISLGTALILLGVASRDRKYSYLSNVKNIDAIIQELHGPCNQQQVTNIAYEFKIFLANKYCESASLNRENNRKRTGHFVKLFYALYATAIFLFLLIGTSAVCAWIDRKSPAKIEVTAATITSMPEASINIPGHVTLNPVTIHTMQVPRSIIAHVPELSTGITCRIVVDQLSNSKTEVNNDRREEGRQGEGQTKRAATAH